jgi:hypothetical protein
VVVALFLVVGHQPGIAEPTPRQPTAVARVSKLHVAPPVTEIGFVRGCGTEVFPVGAKRPSLHLSRGSPAKAFQFGYKSYAKERQITSADGLSLPIKIPVGVAKGATVTVSISSGDRNTTSLLYNLDIGASHTTTGYRVDEGDAVVTFEACGDHETFFNGGILVTGPSCVRLDVQLQQRMQRFFIPVGVRQCR